MEEQPWFRDTVPEGLDGGDWSLIAFGVITGTSRTRILAELRVRWRALGLDARFENEERARAFVEGALQVFGPVRATLRKLYEGETKARLYEDRGVRIMTIERLLAVMEAALLEKLAAGASIADCNLELTHFDRLWRRLEAMQVEQAGGASADDGGGEDDEFQGLTAKQLEYVLKLQVVAKLGSPEIADKELADLKDAIVLELGDGFDFEVWDAELREKYKADLAAKPSPWGAPDGLQK